MPESVTIIAARLSFEDVKNCIYGCTGGEYSLEGKPSEWKSISVRSGKGSLIFSAVRFTAPQDEFCNERLVLSTRADGAEDAPEEVRDRVATAVLRPKMIIGVVGTPRLDSVPRAEDAIYTIAEELGGMVFTGDEFLDPEGNVLLKLPPEEA